MNQMMMNLRSSIAMLVAAVAAAAHAGEGCTRLKPASVYYRLHQTNGFDVVLQVTNADAGAAARPSPSVRVLAWQNKEPEGPMNVRPDGAGTGVLGTREGLDITVHWNNGTVGVYTARARTLRRGFELVGGKTYDAVHPSSQATWASKDRLTCAD